MILNSIIILLVNQSIVARTYFIHIHLDNRLQQVTYLTNPADTSAEPGETRNGWKKCFYSERPLGKKFIVVCELNKSTYTPLTRQFAIRVGYNQGVGLREVEVFGFGKCLYKITLLSLSLLNSFSIFDKHCSICRKHDHNQ